jgi:hypothetical protein
MKAAKKERRRALYEAKMQRRERLPQRRANRPERGCKSREFREWFDKKRVWNEIMDRKARQANQEWQLQVAAIVERLPVVLPDPPEWMSDYMDLREYLDLFGKEYPKELGMVPEGVDDHMRLYTNEELLGK